MKTRGNLAVMGRLVGMVRPLLPVMVCAVAMAFCARFLSRCWAATLCWMCCG